MPSVAHDERHREHQPQLGPLADGHILRHAWVGRAEVAQEEVLQSEVEGHHDRDQSADRDQHAERAVAQQLQALQDGRPPVDRVGFLRRDRRGVRQEQAEAGVQPTEPPGGAGSRGTRPTDAGNLEERPEERRQPRRDVPARGTSRKTSPQRSSRSCPRAGCSEPVPSRARRGSGTRRSWSGRSSACRGCSRRTSGQTAARSWSCTRLRAAGMPPRHEGRHHPLAREVAVGQLADDHRPEDRAEAVDRHEEPRCGPGSADSPVADEPDRPGSQTPQTRY